MAVYVVGRGCSTVNVYEGLLGWCRSTGMTSRCSSATLRSRPCGHSEFPSLTTTIKLGIACKSMPFIQQLTEILAPQDPGHSHAVYRSMGGLFKPPLWPGIQSERDGEGMAHFSWLCSCTWGEGNSWHLGCSLRATNTYAQGPVDAPAPQKGDPGLDPHPGWAVDGCRGPSVRHTGMVGRGHPRDTRDWTNHEFRAQILRQQGAFMVVEATEDDARCWTPS